MQRRRRAFIVPATLCGTSCALLALAASAPLQAVEPIHEPLWITDGEVRAVEQANGEVYVGGAFEAVGPAIGGAAIFDLGTAAARVPYPGVDGTVYAMVPDASGGYYLGGDFQHVRGQPRASLAHVDAAGDVSAWNPGVSGIVYALALDGSHLFVGGDFIFAGGQVRTGIAAVDVTTAQALSWAPYLESPGIVYALALSATTLYVGGSFSRVDFVTYNCTAAFDRTTLIQTSFYAPASAAVRALAVRGNTLYLGGSFSQVNGSGQPGLVAVDATTGQVQPWSPILTHASLPVVVNAVAVTERTVFPFDRTVWVGGTFDAIGADARSNLAAIDGTSALATPWNPGADGSVDAVVVRTSGATGAPVTIYAGGDFTSLGGVTRSHLGAIDAAGVATPWFPEPNRRVHCLFYAVDGIRAGGEFFSAAMTPRKNLASLDFATGAVTGWNPEADGGVNALLLDDDRLLVGGAFGLTGGALRAGLAEFDLLTGLPTAWNAALACPDLGCSEPVVHAIALSSDGGTLYVGGEFESVGGTPRHNLAAIDRTSALPASFDVNANGAVRTLAIREETSFPFEVVVYAGGDFGTVNGGLFGYGSGGLARYGLAALDGTTGEATGWHPDRDSWTGVHAVSYTRQSLSDPGTVWVGGSFQEVGPFVDPTLRSNAAAFDVVTAEPTAWAPDPDAPVTALLVANGLCYLGGDFANLGATSRVGLASVDLVSGAPTAWNPVVTGPGSVLAMKAVGGWVHVGGGFTGVAGSAHRYLVSIAEPAAVTAPEPAAAPTTTLLTARPNPFVDRTACRVALATGGFAEVRVHDVAGRLVRRLHAGPLARGVHEFSWDGADDAGVRVPSGVYFLRVRTPGQSQVAKVTRLD